MGAIEQAMAALQAEAVGYSGGVQIWMRVMALSFFAGIIFVPWRRQALWIVLMAAATFVLLVVGKLVAPQVSRSLMGSAIHWLIWPVAWWLCWRNVGAKPLQASASAGLLQQLFVGWRYWVSLLIAISLVLDARYLVQQLLA